MAALLRVGAGRNVAVVTGAGLLTMVAVASGFRVAHPMTATVTRLAASAAAESADAADAPNKLRLHPELRLGGVHIAYSKEHSCLKESEMGAKFNCRYKDTLYSLRTTNSILYPQTENKMCDVVDGLVT